MRRKYFRNISGASLMEVIFVLGIMAVLTPVVIQFAFKDLADVRYLNLAKQLKEVIKTLSAYASTERDTWVKDSGVIKTTDAGVGEGLAKYGLVDSIDEKLFKNLSLKYVKNGDDKILYGVIDMSDFQLDAISFNKTLLYVGDNIGYVVSGEKCGECSSNACACAINGKWGVNFSEASNIGTPGNKKLYAVIRIDGSLIEDEYSSEVYLYRNRVDNYANTMSRDLDMGANSLNRSDFKDIKNVKGIDATFVGGIPVGSGSGAVVENLKALNSINGTFSGVLNVLDSIYFLSTGVVDESGKETSKSVLNFVAPTKILVPKIVLKKQTQLSELSLPNAYLLMFQGETVKPGIKAKDVELRNVDLQNLSLISSDSDFNNSKKLDIYGFDEEHGPYNAENESSENYVRNSRIRAEIPNVNAKNLNVKIININGGNYIESKNGLIKFQGGKILLGTGAKVNIYNLKGHSPKSLFNIIQDLNGILNEITKV